LKSQVRPPFAHALVSVVMAVACLTLCVACDAPPVGAAQAAPATGWRPLGSWSGNGNRQTESFNVATGALRLRWESRATGANGAAFKVWLYSAISGRPLQLVVDNAGAGSGTAHIADDPRVSYLVVESAHTEWTAALDEAVVNVQQR
jgi:hypothetical protein